jgi:hypothetical protein
LITQIVQALPHLQCIHTHTFPNVSQARSHCATTQLLICAHPPCSLLKAPSTTQTHSHHALTHPGNLPQAPATVQALLRKSTFHHTHPRSHHALTHSGHLPQAPATMQALLQKSTFHHTHSLSPCAHTLWQSSSGTPYRASPHLAAYL